MKSKKKILIIVAIILVIILALAGTVAGMIMTGNLAITTRQKFAKGLSEIGSKASISQLDEKLKEQQKIQTTPFESETTITGKVNKIELDNTTLEEIVKEVENVINNTKITNTLKADLKNKIINNNITVNLSDVVEEISADLEYSNDTISIKSKELNDKYITFSKNDIESDNQYEELANIFDIFEKICNNGTTNLYLTDTEKAHFIENYQAIFSSYITDNMLMESKTDITVDGETKQCDSINFTLDKNQIVELVGKYIKKLEEDEKGKQIILSKIQSIVKTFEEEDLQEIIEELKYNLLYLEDNTIMKVSIYCTMFKTYGFNIDFYLNDSEYTKAKFIMGKEEEELNISTNEGVVLKAIKVPNRTEINIFGEGDNSAIITAKTNGTQKTITIDINDVKDNVKLNLILTNDQITNTSNESKSNNTLQVVLQVGNNNVDITLNIDTDKRYVNTIEKTEITDSNSVNIVTADAQEGQEYINGIQNNLITLMQKATQNSKLIQQIYRTLIGGISGTTQQTTNQDIQTFNNMFKGYVGTQEGLAMRTLLQQVSTSNITNEYHKITVSIVEDGETKLNATANPEEIRSAINSIELSNYYEVLATSVDSAGYITGIEIRKK